MILSLTFLRTLMGSDSQTLLMRIGGSRPPGVCLDVVTRCRLVKKTHSILTLTLTHGTRRMRKYIGIQKSPSSYARGNRH